MMLNVLVLMIRITGFSAFFWPMANGHKIVQELDDYRQNGKPKGVWHDKEE